MHFLAHLHFKGIALKHFRCSLIILNFKFYLSYCSTMTEIDINAKLRDKVKDE